ncbi:insulin-like growth factor-binding protein complex acid labile subunit [Watersipora subatra]|uniref:insulin-like growth factor-binding protein complex acid labile subunit n=1 Tax=Watersipora subatra TaxID=2589382 RepID=UPI00355B1409
MHAYMLLILALSVPFTRSTACPSVCKCTHLYKDVDCSRKGLTTVPSPFPDSAVSITLSHNQLSVITNENFQNLSQLFKLSLSNNNLVFIPSDAFDGCSNLTILEINGNYLQNLTLDNLPVLRTLYAADNHLISIPTLGNIRKLESLYLSGNLLESANFPQQFESAMSLKAITLSNNEKLKAISQANFQYLRNCRHLTKLYVSRCSISTIEGGSFTPLADTLVSLRLSQNPIDFKALQSVLTDFANSSTLLSLELEGNDLHGEITNSTFQVLGPRSRLNNLDLTSSMYVTGVQQKAFEKLKYLVHLAITETSMTDIPYLQNMHNLITLDLSHNNIRSVSCTALPTKLTTLSLNSNRISNLGTSPFAQLAHLTKLRLDDNLLNQFMAHDLIGLSGLHSLNLSCNKLSYIPKGAFSVPCNLNTLDLSSNNFQDINSTALSPLAQLQTLDLRHNAISSFNPALFSTLTNLTSLRLSNNNLGRAFSDTHLNYAGIFSNLTKLVLLDLSYNAITRLPAGLLSGSMHLRSLNLGCNNIAIWDSDTLKGLGSVKTLLLKTNNLAVLDGSSFDSVRNLSQLDLSNNPFACTCNMRSFRDWLNSTKIEMVSYHSYQCASPPDLRGTRLLWFDLSKIQCLPTWVWVIVGVGAGVLLLMGIICILYRYRWKIGYRLHKCATSCRCCPCCRNEENYMPVLGDNQYAAYLSYCREEICEELVADSILPSIDDTGSVQEGRLYPVLHREDGEVFGGSISYYQSLEVALENSASFIVFVCKHYKNDSKQRFELDLILSTDKPMILLCAQNANIKDIPTLLQPKFVANRHITWVPDQSTSVHQLKGELARVWNPPNRDHQLTGDDRQSVTPEPIQPYYSPSELNPQTPGDTY